MRFVDFIPKIQNKPLYLKVLILLLLITSFLMLTMVVGLVIAIPFFGFEVFTKFSNLGNLEDPDTINLLKYLQAINQIGFFIIPSIMYAFLYNRNIGRYLKLTERLNGPVFIISLMILLVSIPAINYLVELNEQMSLPALFRGIEDWMRESEDKTNQLADAFLNTKAFSGFLVNMLIIALLAAVGEELLFRGVFLRLIFEGSRNIHLAIFISAFLFSALHLQFYGFLPRLIIGMIFGYIYYWSANLWIPIILHFVFNGISVSAAYLYETGRITEDVESFGTSENVLVIVMSFGLAVGLLYLLYRRKSPVF
ncbi:MAG: CPBP family intramembrane metalloprotease [Bacteroidales bacterium]|nr:CPBP family intramembrane metalloprotease [Bacteroidales bacterium]